MMEGFRSGSGGFSCSASWSPSRGSSRDAASEGREEGVQAIGQRSPQRSEKKQQLPRKKEERKRCISFDFRNIFLPREWEGKKEGCIEAAVGIKARGLEEEDALAWVVGGIEVALLRSWRQEGGGIGGGG